MTSVAMLDQRRKDVILLHVLLLCLHVNLCACVHSMDFCFMCLFILMSLQGLTTYLEQVKVHLSVRKGA